MVDFTTPNLPGTSILYNTIAKKVQEVEDKILTDANLSATASSLTAVINTDLTDLKEKTKGLIPELPTGTPLNLQAELQSLNGLTLGSDQYANKLASITSSFGSSISAGGYSLDTIVSDSASVLSDAASALADATSLGTIPTVSASSALSAKIPNFELPPGATEAIEKAKAALLPEIEAVKEAAPTFSVDEAEDLVTGIFGDKKARDNLANDLAALEAKLKPHADAFEARVKRLDDKIKQLNTNQREQEEFIDL